MNETAVKLVVQEWLKASYEWVIPEFTVEDGRLDFLAARWLDDGWRLDLLGVECKGEASAAEVWKITSEQLRRYARCVPVLYFACSVSRDSRIAEFEALCKIAGVGLLACVEGEAAPRVFPPGSELGTRLDRAAYLWQVRTVAALFIAFQDVVGTDVRRGPNWFATRTAVQWSVYSNERAPGWFISVNIENVRQPLTTIDQGAFVGALRRLPADAILYATQERYFGQGRRATLPLLGLAANDVTLDAFAYLKRAASVKGQTLHLDIALPLVVSTDARDRASYAERIRAAQRILGDVHSQLSGG